MQNIIITLFVILICYISFFLVCREFNSQNKIIYIFPAILLIVLSITIPHKGILFYGLLWSYCVMLFVSISDIFYREVHKYSYFFLVPSIIISFIYSEMFVSNVISGIVIFGIFFISDKFGLLNDIGGADLKYILLLSLFYPIDWVFMFVISSLFFTLISALFLMIIKRTTSISNPMLVGITIGHILISIISLVL